MNNRRAFTRNVLVASCAFLPFTGIFTQCKSPKKEQATDPCQDLSGLTETELATRDQMGYINQSSFSERNCMNCKLYVKTDSSLTCGNCLVVKGPVEDSGYCTVWAPLEV